MADSTLAVRTPFAGVGVAREAVPGKGVAAGERLATVVDTRTVWALVQLPEELGARAALGAPVVFTTPALEPTKVFFDAVFSGPALVPSSVLSVPTVFHWPAFAPRWTFELPVVFE